MQKTKFAIDFLAGTTFEGYTKGEDWNGFACPYFTFEQGQELIKAWQESGAAASYKSTSDEFIFEMLDGAQDSFGPIEIAGLKVYPIGTRCWIWDEY